MARAPNTKKEEAKKLREKAKKMFEAGVSLAEIAKQIKKPAGTVRRWKSEYGWGEETSVRKAKSERSENAHDPASAPEDQGTETGGAKNQTLDGRQEKFCIYYSRTFNATDAYQWAYGCSREAAGVSGCRLLKNPKIQAEIKKLKTGALTRAMLEADDIVERYIRIAFADIGSYIEDASGGEITFKDLRETDTSLIREAKNTKHGMSIKLADSTKALGWLADHYDLLTKEQQARVAMMQSKSAAEAEDEGVTGVLMIQEVEEDEDE